GLIHSFVQSERVPAGRSAQSRGRPRPSGLGDSGLPPRVPSKAAFWGIEPWYVPVVFSGKFKPPPRQCLISAVHHASILTSLLLSYPVPCSQNRIGSPAWARPRLAEAAKRKPVVLAGSRPEISSCVMRTSLR